MVYDAIEKEVVRRPHHRYVGFYADERIVNALLLTLSSPHPAGGLVPEPHVEHAAVVQSTQIEAVTGLDRYRFTRQFRAVYGTGPHRYSVMRRLDAAPGLAAR